MNKTYKKTPGYASIAVSSILLISCLIIIILSILNYNNTLKYKHYIIITGTMIMLSSALLFGNIFIFKFTNKYTEKEEEKGSKKLINTNIGLFVSSIVLFIITLFIYISVIYTNTRLVNKPIYINKIKTNYNCKNSKGYTNLNCEINTGGPAIQNKKLKTIIKIIEYNHKNTSAKEYIDRVEITAPGETNDNKIVMDKVIESIDGDGYNAKINIHENEN